MVTGDEAVVRLIVYLIRADDHALARRLAELFWEVRERHETVPDREVMA
ncbi:MAG: hypothetical protein ABIH46_11535 [Chloroflexota bacterium]